MQTIRLHFICLLLLLLTNACATRVETVGTGMSYATLLSISDGDGYSLVKVRDPWHEGQTLHTYLLVDRTSRTHLPDSIASLPAERISVPLRHIATLSAVHAALLFELGAGQCVRGMADTEYVMADTLRHAIKSGQIADLGSSMQPDRERMIAIGADALWASPYEGANSITTTDIPLVSCADYMEDTPLGRAEWMRFYGRLVDRGAAADALFRQVDSCYTSLAGRTSRLRNRPRVFCDLMQGDTWPMPGGRSYRARLMDDAGADYVFASTEERGSIFLSPEEVLAHAADAPIWLVHHGGPQPLRLGDLRGSQAVYARLSALVGGKVYECNTRRVPYYEEVPFHPELLLRDVAAICHPELFAGQSWHYYRLVLP